MALHSRCNTCVPSAGHRAGGRRHFSVDSARPRTSRIGRSASRRRPALRSGRRGLRPAACHIARGQPRGGYHCKAHRSCCPRRGAGGRNACKVRHPCVHESAPCFSSARSCGTSSGPCPRRDSPRPCPLRNAHAQPCGALHRMDCTGGGRAGVSPYRTSGTGLGLRARRSAVGSVAACVRAPSRDPCTSSCRRLFVSRRVFARPFDASLRSARIKGGRSRAKPVHTANTSPGPSARRYDAGSIRGCVLDRSRDSHRPLAFSLSGLKSMRRTCGRWDALGATRLSVACVPRRERLRKFPNIGFRP